MILVHWLAYRVTEAGDELVGEFWAPEGYEEAYHWAFEELHAHVDILHRNGLPPRHVESCPSHNGDAP